MKHIFFVANGHLLSTQSIHFACYLAQLTQASLTGIFIDEDPPGLVPPVSAPFYTKTAKAQQALSHLITDTDESMRTFSHTCKSHNIAATAFHKPGDGAAAVAPESRFADVLLLGAELVFNPIYNQVPTPFTRQVLARAECPVVVAPTSFTEIDTIVFCYDGSAAAVFAIKQFTYLFPQFCDAKLVVLSVGAEAGTSVAAKKMQAWVCLYYSQIGYEVLEGNAPEQLYNYLLLKERAFVVMGAYGRNLLSTLWRPSTADALLKQIDLPLFFTHH